MNFSPELEQYRITYGDMRSNPWEPFGAFLIPENSGYLTVIACDGKDTGWEHVSVSKPNRCPNWPEMCRVKSLFWGPDETVIQYHPAESDYVNNHQYCLHLWRPVGVELLMPPKELV